MIMSLSFSELFETSGRHALYRFWIFSDLQQEDPELAERYFRTALRDFRSLPVKPDGICYLGDASQGCDRTGIDIMIRMQLNELEKLGIPVYYVMGNHEFDYYHHCLRTGQKPCVPFFDAIRGNPQWHTVSSMEDFYFTAEFPEFTMLFFSDHAAEDGSWSAIHQKKQTATPHTAEKWREVRNRIGNTGKPVFTFSHYAFPGGNRPSEHLAQILPLPDSFRAHFYGHAHIGDGVWAGKDLYRQISGTDDSPAVQFDVSSLDHLRGTTVRSAFFDYYGDGMFGVFFRDHLNGCWENIYLSARDTKSAGIPEKMQNPR